MRIAIYSDVHGNLTALQTVLADIKQQAPDLVAFAGDMCWMGARPKACLELARSETDIFVYGNTDEFIHSPQPMPENVTEEEEARWKDFYETAIWLQTQLGSENVDWLSRLPFSHRIGPTAVPSDDLLIVHANPLDVTRMIAPTDEFQQEILGKVEWPQSDEELRPLLENNTAGIIAFGHLHVPNVRRWEDTILANISSVNLPSDGNNRAKYGLLTWHKGEGWMVEKRLVAYNTHQEREILSFVKPPNWEYLLERLAK
ncbi:metallophosphoesterase family protein [Candidatus Leptofilum sp.]|uniref:metallophosphoesterase family protein n=1 Tax=Candidatus Leptofilum sp. TaxID=3241576 RepID=UPI003B5C2912